jgi:hypothetical protein
VSDFLRLLLAADINECTRYPNGYCDSKTTCTNTVGSRTCSACPAGESCCTKCLSLDFPVGVCLFFAFVLGGAWCLLLLSWCMSHRMPCVCVCVLIDLMSLLGSVLNRSGFFGSGEFGCVNPKDAGTIAVRGFAVMMMCLMIFETILLKGVDVGFGFRPLRFGA